MTMLSLMFVSIVFKDFCMFELLPVLCNWHSVQPPPCVPDLTAGHFVCCPPGPGPRGPGPGLLAAPEFS